MRRFRAGKSDSNPLIRLAVQRNTVTNTVEIARYVVPPASYPLAPFSALSTNRHSTSFMILSGIGRTIEEIIETWLLEHPPKVRPEKRAGIC